MYPMLPSVLIVVICMLLEIVSFLLVKFTFLLYFVTYNALVFHLLYQLINLDLIDAAQKVIEVYHLHPYPVCERADYQRCLLMLVRVDQVVKLINNSDLVNDLGLLIKLNLDLSALADMVVPEHNTVDPLVTDPADVLLVS